jgi:hypothetical protein
MLDMLEYTRVPDEFLSSPYDHHPARLPGNECDVGWAGVSFGAGHPTPGSHIELRGHNEGRCRL